MTMQKSNCGTPGQVSYRENRRIHRLVKHGKASTYLPYRGVDEAIVAAGLP